MDREELRCAIRDSHISAVGVIVAASRPLVNKTIVMPHYLELVWYKGCADLRAEASRAYLGTLWWVLEPLLYMIVFYLVFGHLLQRGGEGFISFLLCGLVVWRWFVTSVSRGANAISANAGLMRQVYLPKYLFPAIVLVTSTLKFLIVFGLLLAYLLIFEAPPSWAWVALPLLLITQLLWSAACACVFAAIVPFVPDLKIIINNGLTLLFFMSGIFYDIGELSADAQFYFYLNPMATIIANYRLVLIEGGWPQLDAIGLSLAMSLIGLTIGIYLLTRYDRVYPKLVAS